MGNSVKKRYFARHGKLKLLFKKFHFKSDGLFYLLYYFQKRKGKLYYILTNVLKKTLKYYFVFC